MMSLIARILLILAIFFGVLIALGSGIGTVEISIWFAALIAAIFFTVRRHQRSSNSDS